MQRKTSGMSNSRTHDPPAPWSASLTSWYNYSDYWLTEIDLKVTRIDRVNYFFCRHEDMNWLIDTHKNNYPHAYHTLQDSQVICLVQRVTSSIQSTPKSTKIWQDLCLTTLLLRHITRMFLLKDVFTFPYCFFLNNYLYTVL